MNRLQNSYRKHPRVYAKRHERIKDMEDNENETGIDFTEGEISMSGVIAAGILAAVFLKGVFWGYVLKRRY